jgi:cell division protease FtsH
MVCEWGMSDRLGPIKYREPEEDVFLGREMANPQNHSQATAVVIDEEVRHIVDGCYKNAEELLEQRRNSIELVAKALMEHEVISGEELDALMKNGKIERRVPVKQVEPRFLPIVVAKPKQTETGSAGLGGASATPQPA